MKTINLTLPPEEQISEVGYLHQKGVKETYPMHTHDFYEFFYLISGKAIHQVNGERQLITKGSLVFIRPSDVHQYSFFNNYDMELLSCGVTVPLLQHACLYMGLDTARFASCPLPPHILLENSDYWNMLGWLTGISARAPGAERKQYFLSILPQLLYLFTEPSRDRHEPLPVWLSGLIEAMSRPENFIEGLERMISLSNISQAHLTREFRKHLNITPTEFINMKRINYASELLLQHKHEILDISLTCGYNNLSYFYEVFKKQYNCTPKQFIAKNST